MPDPLSQFIQQITPRCEVFAQVQLREPWGIEEHASQQAFFSYLRSGRCLIDTQAGHRVELQPGQLALLPYGHQHRIRSSQQASCQSAQYLFANKDQHEIEAMTIGGNGAHCQMMCGAFSFAPLTHWGRDANIGFLPEVFVVEVDANSRLQQILLWLYEENSQHQAGRSMAIEHLSQLLLLEMLRFGQPTQRWPGWMHTFNDERLAKVMLAIQQRYQYDWTLEQLAAIAALSRSSFAERFKQITGTSAMAFLRQWRCFMAAQQLVSSQLSIKQLAHNVGFPSVDVFIRNFRQFHQCTPAQYRQRFRDNSQAQAISR